MTFSRLNTDFGYSFITQESSPAIHGMDNFKYSANPPKASLLSRETNLKRG